MKVSVIRNSRIKPSVLSIRCALSGLLLGHAYHVELTQCTLSRSKLSPSISGFLEYVTNFISKSERRLDEDVLHITEEEIQLIRDVTIDNPRVFKPLEQQGGSFILKGTEIPAHSAEAISFYADGSIYAREPKP